MSGGHWGYLDFRLEESAEDMLEGVRRGAEALKLLAAIEHELDWGICGDTCYTCAMRRVVPALEAYFDDGALSAGAAIAVIKNRNEYLCERCEAFKRERENRARG